MIDCTTLVVISGRSRKVVIMKWTRVGRAPFAQTWSAAVRIIGYTKG